MLDIRWVAENRDLVRAGAEAKGFHVDLDRLLALYDKWRVQEAAIQAIAAEKNRSTREMPSLSPEQRAERKGRLRELTSHEASLRAEVAGLEEEWRGLLSLVPQPPSPEVPLGKDDRDNVEIRRWGAIPEFSFTPKSHIEIGTSLDIIDRERAAKIAGSRTYFLKGDGALLEQAVLQFAIDLLVRERGFTLVVPPVLVRDQAMFGTGYFPGGEDQAYRVPEDGLNLVGTAEVPLTSYYGGETLTQAQLPIRMAGLSTCFRREAGAAGKDTAGIYRVHQFQKVEQVVLCAADEEENLAHHAAILGNAERIMQMLELPYRVVNVCTGDLGRGQVQKFDIEAWMPSRNAFGETHSASRFNDYQARRLNIRYRDSAGRLRYCYTLNNTAVASPRILIALLEIHQRGDGSVAIPTALRPYMHGRERIGGTAS